jgi:two-component system nitrogen regulation sensor histidine kinase NtrY
MEDKLRAGGRLLTLELEGKKRGTLQDREILKSFLDQQRETYKLTGLEALDQAGTSLAASYDTAVGDLPELPVQLTSPASTTGEAIHRQRAASGELLTLLIPLKDGAGYLAARQLIPKPHLVQMAGTERGIRDLRQMQFLLKPVRVSHYLTLVIVTLLVIMSAFWLAFYMAREITTPIRQLAEGAHKVAEGDYDFHIDLEGRDEIGFLVQSFNKMTQDLQHSQAQLAAAYRQLSESHAMLSDQKQHMEILLKNVAAGVIGIDAQGRVTTINDSAAQMLRLRREEVLGQSGRLLLPPGEYNRLAEVIATARRSPRGTVERSLHLMLPDQTLYLLLKPTVLKDDAGGDLGIVIVFEDLTELERAQRLAAWREVARRIAHEVKNPLTPIKLAAQRLRRRYLGRLGGDGQVLDECTQIIVSEVDELKNLVNEFSRYARLPQLTLAPQDLNSLIQETLLLYQEAQPRITLEFLPDAQLPPLLLDREQIKRVLLNLLDNALASIKDTGKISINLQGDDRQQRATLTVADTGCGIPERDKVRIFEPYFSTKRSGTGLGLAIVNSIVAEHQGDIRVEDNVPQGTRFIIELPLHRG